MVVVLKTTSLGAPCPAGMCLVLLKQSLPQGRRVITPPLSGSPSRGTPAHSHTRVCEHALAGTQALQFSLWPGPERASMATVSPTKTPWDHPFICEPIFSTWKHFHQGSQ